MPPEKETGNRTVFIVFGAWKSGKIYKIHKIHISSYFVAFFLPALCRKRA